MKELLRYLNPLARLGNKKYSVFFPLIFSIVVCVLSEMFAYGVVKNPEIVGVYIIFINVASIIYFAFRDGVKGGFTAVVVPIAYYFYIIYTRNYTGDRFIGGIEATLVLAALYLVLAGVIGWLKQTIDGLIEREADGRKRLESIIEQLPVGVIITDSEARVTQTNKQVENILGIGIPKGFVIGKDKPILDGQHKNKIITPSHSPVAQALVSGKQVTNREFLVEKRDGKRLFLQVNASPIRNGRGQIFAATSIVTDITAQKEMESRKDEFINMASHELKTPITSMKLYVDFLLGKIKEKDERVIKSLKSMKYQIEKMQELIAGLLDISRIQTGKLTFNKEQFNISELIKETISELQATTHRHKISLLNKAAINIYGDKFRISQVLTNLLTNGIKYSPDGGNINIGIKRQAGKILISVEDEGIGISKSEHNKIFEKLYQVVDPQVKTFPGLGMGLYITKEIIKRHGGRIWVENKKSRGSIFYFELPLKKT